MNLEKIKSEIEAAVPGCSVRIVLNSSPSEQHSLVLGREHALEVARFLRDESELRLDYCSNVTGFRSVPTPLTVTSTTSPSRR